MYKLKVMLSVSVVLMLMSAQVWAAQVLQSSPYAASDLQPDTFACVFTPSGGAAVNKVFPATKNADGTSMLSQDLAAAGLPVGVYSAVVCVAQKATFADSSASNTLQVSLGVLKSPAILILSQ